MSHDTTLRADMREPMREEPRRERKRKGNEFDQFYIDPRDIPPGWDWNWKRTDVVGKDMEDHHIQGLVENGWTPVMAEKHTQYSSKASGSITRPGYVLMERPKYLTEEAQKETEERALGMEKQKRDELFLNTGGNKLRVDHNRSFGPVDVPV